MDCPDRARFSKSKGHTSLRVVLWRSNKENKNQQLMFNDDGTVVLWDSGNYALTVHGKADGEKVSFEPLGIWGRDYQKFKYTKAGRLVHVDSGKCIEIANGADKNNAKLQLWSIRDGAECKRQK